MRCDLVQSSIGNFQWVPSLETDVKWVRYSTLIKNCQKIEISWVPCFLHVHEIQCNLRNSISEL